LFDSKGGNMGWTDSFKETQGRRGFIPWLSVSIQKWILIGVICFSGISILVGLFTITRGGAIELLWVLLAAPAIYSGIKSKWLKDVNNSSLFVKICGAIAVGFGTLVVVAVVAYMAFIVLAVIIVLIVVIYILAHSGDDKKVSNDTNPRYTPQNSDTVQQPTSKAEKVFKDETLQVHVLYDQDHPAENVGVFVNYKSLLGGCEEKLTNKDGVVKFYNASTGDVEIMINGKVELTTSINTWEHKDVTITIDRPSIF
jgi:hypothetical protein